MERRGLVVARRAPMEEPGARTATHYPGSLLLGLRTILLPCERAASGGCHRVDDVLEAGDELVVRGVRVPHELRGRGELRGCEHGGARRLELSEVSAEVLVQQSEAGRVVGAHLLLDVVDVVLRFVHVVVGVLDVDNKYRRLSTRDWALCIGCILW